MAAGINETADADAIAHLEFRNVLADGGHEPGDFMPGNLRHFLLARPVSEAGMHIAVANAAVMDVDGDIIIGQRAVLEIQRREFAGKVAERVAVCGNRLTVIVGAVIGLAGRDGVQRQQCRQRAQRAEADDGGDTAQAAAGRVDIIVRGLLHDYP